jgi:hypothetical protein
MISGRSTSSPTRCFGGSGNHRPPRTFNSADPAHFKRATLHSPLRVIQLCPCWLVGLSPRRVDGLTEPCTCLCVPVRACFCVSVRADLCRCLHLFPSLCCTRVCARFPSARGRRRAQCAPPARRFLHAAQAGASRLRMCRSRDGEYSHRSHRLDWRPLQCPALRVCPSCARPCG